MEIDDKILVTGQKILIQGQIGWWRKFKRWWFRRIIGRKEYDMNGVYRVNKISK